MLCSCLRLCVFTLTLTPASPLFLDYLLGKGGSKNCVSPLVLNWELPAPQCTVYPWHATQVSLHRQRFRAHMRPTSMHMMSLDLAHFLHFHLLGFVGLGKVRVLTVTSVHQCHLAVIACMLQYISFSCIHTCFVRLTIIYTHIVKSISLSSSSLVAVAYCWFLAPGARSEIVAPFPDFFPKQISNGRPKTNIGHFEK